MNLLNSPSFTCPRVVVTFALRAGLSGSLWSPAGIGYAQNLVPNWSFEDTAYCTTANNPILVAPPWFSANYATPDIYNMDDSPCGVYMDTTESIGLICYQAPFHGNRFAGAYLRKNLSELKDYMEVGLTQSLQAGHAYRVAMEISLPDCSQQAVSTIGTFFSVDTVFDPTVPIPGALPVVPQALFYEPGYYIDEDDWMHVEDTIVAAGGERFMVIGSFTDNAGTEVLPVTGNFGYDHAYYYFDAIVVEELGEVQSSSQDPTVWSRPGSLTVRWDRVPNVDRLIIWDLHCRRVLDARVLDQGSQVTIDTHILASGTYVVEVVGGGWRGTAKWTKVD